MSRLAKNLILATAVVSAIFIVDFSSVEAANFKHEIFCPFNTYNDQQLDFWSKFRDTVMPDPDEPQDNNPPKPADIEPPESEDNTAQESED